MSTPDRLFARPILPILLGAIALAGPARAEVSDQSDRGFVSRHAVVVSATPDLAWKRLVKIGSWWLSEHTFSGDAANMTLDPVPGGCFCEALPADAAAKGKPLAPPRGGVEHMRVVFVDRMKALRMVGALGPLQSEAVAATLTITLKPVDGGTRILFEYVVGGYMRYPTDKIAGAVDRVMGEQLTGLAKELGPVAEVVVPTPGEPAKPAPTAGGADAKPQLGPEGVLLPRGRIWSLPPSPGAAAPEPAPVIAPLAPIPTTPAPEPQPAPAAPAAPEPAPAPPPVSIAEPPPASVPTVASAPPPALEPPPAALPTAALPPDAALSAPPPAKPKLAAKARTTAKAKAKPAKPAPANPDEPSHDAVNSAFDTMLPAHPQPQR